MGVYETNCKIQQLIATKINITRIQKHSQKRWTCNYDM